MPHSSLVPALTSHDLGLAYLASSVLVLDATHAAVVAYSYGDTCGVTVIDHSDPAHPLVGAAQTFSTGVAATPGFIGLLPSYIVPGRAMFIVGVQANPPKYLVFTWSGTSVALLQMVTDHTFPDVGFLTLNGSYHWPVMCMLSPTRMVSFIATYWDYITAGAVGPGVPTVDYFSVWSIGSGGITWVSQGRVPSHDAFWQGGVYAAWRIDNGRVLVQAGGSSGVEIKVLTESGGIVSYGSSIPGVGGGGAVPALDQFAPGVFRSLGNNDRMLREFTVSGTSVTLTRSTSIGSDFADPPAQIFGASATSPDLSLACGLLVLIDSNNGFRGYGIGFLNPATAIAATSSVTPPAGFAINQGSFDALAIRSFVGGFLLAGAVGTSGVQAIIVASVATTTVPFVLPLKGDVIVQRVGRNVGRGETGAWALVEPALFLLETFPAFVGLGVPEQGPGSPIDLGQILAGTVLTFSLEGRWGKSYTHDPLACHITGPVVSHYIAGSPPRPVTDWVWTFRMDEQAFDFDYDDLVFSLTVRTSAGAPPLRQHARDNPARHGHRDDRQSAIRRGGGTYW